MILSSYRPRVPRELTTPGYQAKIRADFLSRRPANLERLLRSRYEWMQPYVQGKEAVVEFGAGLGLSREFLRCPGLVVTDLEKHPWIDREADVLAPPFADGSLDVCIASHVLHHVSTPSSFFDAMFRVLKPGGVVLLQELEASLLLRLLQRVMRNEGYQLRADPFDPDAECIPGEGDPWEANTAIPALLFADAGAFESRFPGWRVELSEPCEALLLPLSGGVLAKAPAINLPRRALNLAERLDRAVSRRWPRLLALGRRVVLRKRS